MGFISIIIALFGGYLLWYGLNFPPVIAGTYTWLGLAMMFGGIFLAIYSRKK